MKTFVLINLVLIVLFGSSCNSDQVSDEKIEDVIRARDIKMKNLLGINAFEWDVLQNPDTPAIADRIYEPKFNLIKGFGGIRHYLDWEKLENTEGNYTFNPTNRGGWNYDVLYERCKAENIEILVCIKNSPDWLYNTYPVDQRGADNIPAPYKSNRLNPKSYIAHARAAFQFAARYGANKNIDSSLVKVNTKQRWTGDGINEVKIGLNYIKYIECGNEPDKWWLGDRAKHTGSEYAANLSAFYDGHKGKLGKNVGVKTADPNMVVVMGGLGRPDIKFVQEMVEWCKKNRGYRADGSIDLCFDVLNYHLYSNDNTGWFGKFINKKRGVAPELTNQGAIANSFVDFAETLGKSFEVWVTESGYDLNESSVQRAIPIVDKSALVTQADWMLRSTLLYARHGIDRALYYQLYDNNPTGGIFGSSGFVEGTKRRPVADYFLQVKKLMGDYSYYHTIESDPVVDIYIKGNKKMYILFVPDEVDRKEDYELLLQGAKKALVYTLKPNADKMDVTESEVSNGKLELKLTETPIFVEAK
jgi:hypothetical protein